MKNQVILWRRVDQPGHESARLDMTEEMLTLTGAAVFVNDKQPCRLDYVVTCDSNGRTVSAKISGWVGDEPIQIEISVDGLRHWSLNRQECPEVKGCIDLDLNFSPSTNLLQIRRSQLAVGQSTEVTAAWLRFPSFRLEPLKQIYRRVADGVYRYESGDGSFVRELAVNADGFVTAYPDFWEQVA